MRDIMRARASKKQKSRRCAPADASESLRKAETQYHGILFPEVSPKCVQTCKLIEISQYQLRKGTTSEKPIKMVTETLTNTVETNTTTNKPHDTNFNTSRPTTGTTTTTTIKRKNTKTQKQSPRRHKPFPHLQKRQSQKVSRHESHF